MKITDLLAKLAKSTPNYQKEQTTLQNCPRELKAAIEQNKPALVHAQYQNESCLAVVMASLNKRKAEVIKAKPAKSSGSLTVLGFGIKFISHLTPETTAFMEGADKVLYLLNDPVAKDWVQNNIHNAESLDPFYQHHPLRHDNYWAIAEHIVETVQQGLNVCVLVYGHPAILAEPGLIAVEQAKKLGLKAKILPGISAEDCLFADLEINPGSCGCQSFQADDLLVYERPVSAASHLVLWQIGCIGSLGDVEEHNNAVGIRLLTDYLAKQYPSDHKVILYEASQYTCFQPRTEMVLLKDLPQAKISSISTLYVPPAIQLQANAFTLQALGIKL